MKKIVFICLFLLLFPLPCHALSISAQYACLTDAKTGRVIYEKNAHEKYSMASTTKIMTAIVAIEHSSPKDIVTVSKNAAYTEGSSIYLAVGETLTMEELLYGLMLESGNDAAVAIAEHIGGNTETFARMMTEKAKDIGAKNTAFKNPNGLDEDGHYTTAYDLALITRYAMKNPTFAEIFATKKKSFAAESKEKNRYFTNHNKLLTTYPGCIGGKTGFTKKTGRCLVSAAQRDEETLICVTLRAPNDWSDHASLLNYGFDALHASPLFVENMVLKSIPVKKGAKPFLDLLAEKSFFLAKDPEKGLEDIKLSYQIPAKIEAPVPEGAVLGKVSITYKKEIIGEVNLIAGESIDYMPPPQKSVMDNFRLFFNNLLHFI